MLENILKKIWFVIKLDFDYDRLVLLSNFIFHYCVIRLPVMSLIRFSILNHCNIFINCHRKVLNEILPQKT